MKGRFLSVLLLVTFMLVLLQPQSCECKAGWVRKVTRAVRRVVRPIVCGLSCFTGCNWVCTGACNYVCKPVCSRVCNGKKKREFSGASFDEELSAVSDDPRTRGAFPSSFSAYDKDKDGKISLQEFAKTAVSHSHPDFGTKEAFMLSDRNGDHYINCKEFKVAPLLLKAKPSC